MVVIVIVRVTVIGSIQKDCFSKMSRPSKSFWKSKTPRITPSRIITTNNN